MFIRVEINIYGVFKFKKKINIIVFGVCIVVYFVVRGKVCLEGIDYFFFGYCGGWYVRDW